MSSDFLVSFIFSKTSMSHSSGLTPFALQLSMKE